MTNNHPNMRAVFLREMTWAKATAAKYGVAPDRAVELYLHMARHFLTKRERERVERRVQRWTPRRHLLAIAGPRP
jgi:hypothetical protein